jgi:uncharacterized protein (DUF4415 family)
MTRKAAKRRPIVKDDDLPIQGAKFFRRAKPVAEVMPDLATHAEQKKRGRPKLDNPKVAVSLRIDPNVLESFKATGPGWQGVIHEALKTYSAAHLARKGLASSRTAIRAFKAREERGHRKG